MTGCDHRGKRRRYHGKYLDLQIVKNDLGHADAEIIICRWNKEFLFWTHAKAKFILGT
jgi:hypothetical protein